MAKNTPKKIISKKHIARLEREKRQAAIVTYSAIGIVLVVTLLIGYGILNQTVLLARQPVAEVGGYKITTREFQLNVRLARQQMISRYSQILQFASYFGVDPTTDQTFSQQLSQIEAGLQDSISLGQQVLDQMINNLLIRQEAERQGIVISADEIEQAIRAVFEYFPDGTPTPTLTPTAFAYSTLSPTQAALVTPTIIPSPFPTSTPSPTPTPDPAATPTAIPSPSPTATPYTLDGCPQTYQSAVESYASLGMKEADYRKLFEENLYYEAVYAMITKDVAREKEQVWARHILVADESTARLVRNLYLNGGYDWNKLAAEYSTDTGSKDNGGDLGWFGRGAMVAEFENAAFILTIGEVSQPVQSTHGWHVIQALGHEVRPLSAEETRTAQDAIFQEWLQQARDAADITTYDVWVTLVPTDPTLESALGQ